MYTKREVTRSDGRDGKGRKRQAKRLINLEARKCNEGPGRAADK